MSLDVEVDDAGALGGDEEAAGIGESAEFVAAGALGGDRAIGWSGGAAVSVGGAIGGVGRAANVISFHGSMSTIRSMSMTAPLWRGVVIPGEGARGAEEGEHEQEHEHDYDEGDREGVEPLPGGYLPSSILYPRWAFAALAGTGPRLKLEAMRREKTSPGEPAFARGYGGPGTHGPSFTVETVALAAIVAAA